jgi:hypothetical protein
MREKMRRKTAKKIDRRKERKQQRLSVSIFLGSRLGCSSNEGVHSLDKPEVSKCESS